MRLCQTGKLSQSYKVTHRAWQEAFAKMPGPQLGHWQQSRVSQIIMRRPVLRD